jgi:hypothetical protein
MRGWIGSDGFGMSLLSISDIPPGGTYSSRIGFGSCSRLRLRIAKKPNSAAMPSISSAPTPTPIPIPSFAPDASPPDEDDVVVEVVLELEIELIGATVAELLESLLLVVVAAEEDDELLVVE